MVKILFMLGSSLLINSFSLSTCIITIILLYNMVKNDKCNDEGDMSVYSVENNLHI